MILVRVEDLKNMVADLEDEGIELVEVEFIPAQEVEGEYIPAALDFNGITPNGQGMDFGEVEEAEVEE